MKKSSILVLAALFFGVIAGAQTVEYYNYSTGVQRSGKYTVKVNGQDVTVLTTPEPDFAAFGTDGEVTVEVTCPHMTPSSFVVRPLAKKYDYTSNGNTVTIKLKTGDRISVEPDGSTDKPLFIFANPLEAKAVKKARKDGNTIFFGAGEIHEAGEIVPTRGQTVYIQGGAVVNGWIRQREPSANITITGCGVLRKDKENGQVIRIDECYKLNVSNIITVNRNHWTNLFFNCEDVNIKNMHVIATASDKEPGNNENDALNVVGCTNVYIQGCFTYAHDDAYCVKTSCWGLQHPTENVNYEDCVAWNITSGNSFEIGYSLDCEAKNINYRNLYCIHSGGKASKFRRAGISIHQGHGAPIHDISYENVYIEDPLEHLVSFEVFKTPYKSGHQNWHPGRIYNVTVKNIHAWKEAPDGNALHGYDEEHLLENVVFKDFYIGDRKITDISQFDVRPGKGDFTKNIKFE